MTLDEIQKQHDAALMPTYGRFPVALASGHGATAIDVEGRAYIDFGSGIGVNALGYCDEGWVRAVQEQAAALQHISNLYYSPVQVQFAAELCAATGMGRVFLCNSGAEANECSHQAGPQITALTNTGRAVHPSWAGKQLSRPDVDHPVRHRAGRVPPILFPLH